MRGNANAVIMIDANSFTLAVEIDGDTRVWLEKEELTLETLLRFVNLAQNQLDISYGDQMREIRRLHDREQGEAWERDHPIA